MGNKKNVIITGGQLFNKGAQAMVFTVVHELKKRFSDHDIYIISNLDYRRRSKEERDKYLFNIIPNRSYDLTFGKLKIFYKKEKHEEAINLEKILENTSFAIDISGYALSSQFNIDINKFYLSNIALFKKYDIDMYIFPQSIGPFNYKFYEKIIYYPLLFWYLKYPKKLYCRENDGRKEIKKFTRKNVKKHVDIVLTQNVIDPANIFRNEFQIKKISVKSNAVGIIPNSRIIEHNGSNGIMSMYRNMISYLLTNNKTVYILRHSFGDLELCIEIKNMFKDQRNVILIKDDLNVFELNHLIKQFDFIIGSRYHSIIHSYKNGIPALIIGWAVKYFELAKEFNQLGYHFDIREQINERYIYRSLEKLNNFYQDEANIIKNKVVKLSENNIFDELFNNYGISKN